MARLNFELKFVLIISLLFIHFGQFLKADITSNYIATPQATDLGRYGTVPISYYTGTTQVSVPIFSTRQNDVPLDISLVYDGSGVKMNTLPGWTGHSWTLLAGGVITRVKNGYVDEYDGLNEKMQNVKNHFNYQCYSGTKNVTSSNFLSYATASETCDYAADEYYFNFMGKTGKFFLGNDGEWKVLSEQNLSVEFDYTNKDNFELPHIDGRRPVKTIKGFTIIDEMGNQYLFGNSRDGKECVEYSIDFRGIGNRDTISSWEATSWYLSEVKDYLGNQLYDFEYERGYFVTQINLDFYCRVLLLNWGKILTADENNKDFPYDVQLTSPIYLKSISIASGDRLTFTCEAAFRTDSTAYPTIFQKYDNLFKNGGKLFPYCSESTVGNREICAYNYLQKKSNRGVGLYDSLLYPVSNWNETMTNPMKSTGLKYLSSIRIYTPSNYSVRNVVLNYDTIGPMMHLSSVVNGQDCYTLLYENWEQFPKDYATSQVDHWGYYNGKEIIYANYGDIISKPKKFDSFQALMHPDTLYATCGMLKKIIYPTGGCSIFTYEPNEYQSYRSENRQSMLIESGLAGGVRIKKIQNYDCSSNHELKLINTRTITYEGGELYAKPKYGWFDLVFNQAVYSIFRGCSIIPLCNSFCPRIGYSKVYETQESICKLYEYSNLSSTLKDKRSTASNISNETISPFEQFSEFGFLRGKLLKTSLYEDEKLKHYEQYTYRDDWSHIEMDSVVSFTATDFILNTWLGGTYNLYYPKYDVTKTEEGTFCDGQMHVNIVKYDKQDTTITQRFANNFSHHSKIRYIRSVTQIFNPSAHPNDSQTTTKTVFRYTFDDNNYNEYDLYRFHHYIPAIEKRIYQGGSFVKGEKTVFDNGLLPSAMVQYYSEKPSSATTDTLVTYCKYNDLGLPTKLREKGMPYTYLFWDNTRLLASVTTAASSDPEFKANANPKESVTINGESAFQCPETKVKVMTYDGNNIASITEDSGVTTYYEHDAWNRLTKVSDCLHRTLDEYEYHILENGYNYVTHKEFLDESGNRVTDNIQWYDGLGRPVVYATNGKSQTGNFLYTLTEYDAFDRESKVWHSVPGSTLIDNSFSEDFACKSNAFFEDAYGYARQEFDAVGRLLKSTVPGRLWHEGNKSKKHVYSVNASNSVKDYSISKSGTAYYKAGDLTSETVIDEDGHKVSVFKDYRDLKILERRSDGSQTVDTYYVYDDKGRLTKVLQPEFQKYPDYAKFAFQYEYDAKGRTIMKKLPSCEPITYSKFAPIRRRSRLNMQKTVKN